MCTEIGLFPVVGAKGGGRIRGKVMSLKGTPHAQETGISATGKGQVKEYIVAGKGKYLQQVKEKGYLPSTRLPLQQVKGHKMDMSAAGKGSPLQKVKGQVLSL